ncbi:serine/threonine-protein phosphatase 7 long form homolog [Castanea sativa]|uniref:serine/threonine-protein phosphatase 7 long form homolog n=1 Tax=Castanea sativa TaxID=21020 RepID=UPI003F64A383
MAAVAAEVVDQFGPGPKVPSVLRFLIEHRSSAVWEGKDPGVLKCHGRNEEFQKRSPMVDDRVLDIVKRIGLEGLYRTPFRELDHNLIMAFVERWWPETHTFYLSHGEMTITLQDIEVLLGIPIDGEAIVGTCALMWAVESEVAVHQYARCYILALLGDTIFADKELCRATDKKASQIGGALILIQYWAWFRFPFLCPRMDLPPDGAYGPPLPSSPLSIKLVWVVSKKNSPAEICLVRYCQLLDSLYPNQVVWQPYEAELGHLPAFCVAGRDMWTVRVPLVCFWLVEKHTPDHVLRQFGMVQEIPEDVDTDDALHKIDLRGKTEEDWRVRHFSHIQVWNTRAQELCNGARLEGAMLSVHPYFGWYGKVIWRFVDHTSASLLITVAMHKQILMRYVVGSPEHKLITAMLKEVDRLHRLAAHLPLEDANTANPEVPEQNG